VKLFDASVVAEAKLSIGLLKSDALQADKNNSEQAAK
jgi:hypothetical protein